MKALDRLLQRWRIRKARRFVRPASRVLDVGCHRGELFEQLRDLVAEGVGVDPELEEQSRTAGARLYPGVFPDDLPDEPPFDAITMLAVIEHIPEERQAEVARACAASLAPGGRLIITAPSPFVDRILEVLVSLRLVEGMSLEEHFGFEPDRIPEIFADTALELIEQSTFQLGLNHLFVFEKSPRSRADSLDKVERAMALEEEFGIEIPGREAR